MQSTVSLGKALSLIPPGARVVASPGCGGPTTLLRGIGTLGTPGPVTLYSGLQIDGYPFVPALKAGLVSYITWHVMGPVRDLVEAGSVGFVPARASEIPDLLAQWDIDVALVRVGPPAADGSCNLGPSVSYPAEAVRRARVVLAEIDEELPWTYGQADVPAEVITAFVESGTPTPSYVRQTPTDTSNAIAEIAIGLLPRDPVLQVGIGAISESLVDMLAGADLGRIRFVGMGTDPMVDLFEAGVCDGDAVVPDPALRSVELMGTRRLMAFSHRNPSIGVYPSRSGHAPASLGSIPRLVAINTALEVDLSGQVNSEVVGHRQLSGVGGSVDFVESASQSPGGLRITVLPSTTTSGKSRIVPRLGPDGVVTIPRSMADVVVTEFGFARLWGRTMAERAEMLIAIAHPDHRDSLAEGVSSRLAGP